MFEIGTERNGAGAGVVCVARSRLAGRSRHACWATSHGAEAKSPISPSIGQPVVVDKWIMISDTKRREPSRGHGRHFWGVFGDSSRPPVRSIGTRYFFLPCADWGWLGVGRSSQLARIELERLALALGRHPLHFQERQDGEGEREGDRTGKMGKWENGVGRKPPTLSTPSTVSTLLPSENSFIIPRFLTPFISSMPSRVSQEASQPCSHPLGSLSLSDFAIASTIVCRRHTRLALQHHHSKVLADRKSI